MIVSEFREALSYRDFLKYLVRQQFHQRYHGSVLGLFWALLYPLVTFCSLAFVFSYVNHWDIRDYGVFFFSGYVVWNFITNTTLGAADSITGQASFVTSVRVPKLLLPVAFVLAGIIDFLLNLGILMALMAILGAPFSAALAVTPLVVLLLGVFTLGLALVSAVAQVFFRDFKMLLSSVFFIGFFLSPILWKPEAAGPLAMVAAVNPVVPFLRLLQWPVWMRSVPSAQTFLAAGALAVGMFAVGAALFVRLQRRFYYYL
ncbi:MAG: ABC transporter permease [Bryobacterales bacterium]|nr:ABC transporter permease [Bryobacterales bacterium]